jgi:hypothetical protein
VNVPFAGLTANAAFIPFGSTFSDPKTEACRMNTLDSIAGNEMLTCRQSSEQPPLPVAIFLIALSHILRFDHRRVSSPIISSIPPSYTANCVSTHVFHSSSGWRA